VALHRVSTDLEDGANILLSGKRLRMLLGKQRQDLVRRETPERGIWEVEWGQGKSLGDTIESTTCRISIEKVILKRTRIMIRGDNRE
jgi:hypothetical protein